MQNEIMEAVARRLDELFGDSCKIYTDNVEQGLETPCFFISVLQHSDRPMLGRRYLRSYDLMIQYLPEDEKPSAELNRVSDRLDDLEYITLEDGSLMRGTGRQAETVDGVLTFTVSFNAFALHAAPEVTPMAEVKAEIGTERRKNGKEKG